MTDAQAALAQVREALHGLAPTHRCPACGAFWRQCDDASWNLRSASCCGLCDAGRVELVCWLDEPKREPLSDESPKVEWLSTDDAETQLALAIRDAVKVAPSADDKALLYALNRRGIWLAWIGGSDAE